MESVRDPEEDGGSEAMVNTKGCTLLVNSNDELIVLGVSMETRATSEGSEER